MAKILIIDDEPQIRTMLQKMFTIEGHEVAAAGDGAEGVKMFRETLYDVVLTDIIMPEKEGLETIREIRKINPDAKIIVMSGGGNKYNSDVYLELAVKFGAAKALKKPILKEELINTINEVLQAT